MAISMIEMFTLAAFLAVGVWLGRTGRRNGLLDELLTPGLHVVAMGARRARNSKCLMMLQTM
jgi:hypothetical protein